LLITKIEQLSGTGISFITQSSFDEWHENLCTKLKAAYSDGGYSAFTDGQGQKWISMTFKYLYVFGEGRCQGYEQFYKFCHVPIDNIIAQLRAKNQSNLPPGFEAWA
jgi:hypothetical protein